ncbi:MAG: response regulator [Clostridia bacterium]|nr:response regulator [Clostridia bacterium]
MNIWIVEDAPLELRRLERLVKQCAPEDALRSFPDAEEALAAGEPLPDVAFLDVELPGMSGVELAGKLCAQKPDCNIVFTTAYSDYMPDAFSLFASGYLLKPFAVEEVAAQLAHLRHPVRTEAPRLYAQTAGSFELFCDGKPVAFASSRSKEMLAYLIDRRGASVTKKELFAVLFEDSSYTAGKQDHMKKIARSLRVSLEAVGCGDLLLHTRNSYAVDTALLRCDLYEAQKNHTEEALFSVAGYMEQYSWSEGRWR